MITPAIPGVDDVVDQILEAIATGIGGAMQEVFGALLHFVAKAVADFAVLCIAWLFGALSEITRPQVSADFIYEWAGRLFAISLPITVGFLIFQVIHTMLKGGGLAGLWRGVYGVAIAMLGTAISVPVIALLVVAIDTLADNLMSAVIGDVDELGQEVAGWFAPETWSGEAAADWATVAPGGPTAVLSLAALFFGALTVLACVAVGAALVLRNVILYVVVVAAPLMLMGAAWDVTRAWPRRWAAAVVALLFTKLGIVVVLGLGVSALRSLGDPQDSFGAWLGIMLTGVVMFALGAFVPVVCMKFFAFIGDEVGTAVLAREAGSGVQGAVAAAGSMAHAPSAKDLLSKLNSPSGAAGSGGAQGSPRAPLPTSAPSSISSGPSTAAPAAAGPAPGAPGVAGTSSTAGAAGSAAAAGPAVAAAAVATAPITAASGVRGAAEQAGSHVETQPTIAPTPSQAPTPSTPAPVPPGAAAAEKASVEALPPGRVPVDERGRSV